MDKKTIAAFDFDGTITTRDTLFDFIRFYKGMPRMIVGLLFISPVLVLFKLRFLSNSRAKEILFSHFFRGEKLEAFNRVCEEYSSRIMEITRPEAVEKIKSHLNQHDKLIIVSASIDQWISPWAKKAGFSDIIATRIEVIDGIITGKLSGKNCYGKEKVNRLQEAFPDRSSYTLYAYGDSSGDKELLAFADHPFYRKF